MITVVFWNVNDKQGSLPHLSCLAERHGVDVFLLAECPTDPTPALAALGQLQAGNYREATNGGSKVRALTRLGDADFSHRFTGIAGDLAVWSVRAPNLTPGAEVLLAGVHLPSKAGGVTDTDQAGAAQEVITELNETEDLRGHRNTACVGDFNMRPDDAGVTSVAGFHGLMTRTLADLPDRTYRKRNRRRFYNPMWGLMGDRTPGPAGTYRWTGSAPHNPHWAIRDQLLLRPRLVGHLADLAILGHDGAHTLVGADEFPDDDNYSDHLPVLFRLDV